MIVSGLLSIHHHSHVLHCEDRLNVKESISTGFYLLLAMAVLLANQDMQASSAQQPSWSPVVIARGAYRQQIKSLPIEMRPNRPFHFYGNAIRREHYRSTSSAQHSYGVPTNYPAPRGYSTVTSYPAPVYRGYSSYQQFSYPSPNYVPKARVGSFQAYPPVQVNVATRRFRRW